MNKQFNYMKDHFFTDPFESIAGNLQEKAVRYVKNNNPLRVIIAYITIINAQKMPIKT